MLHRKIPWNNSPWGLSAAKGLSRGGVGEDTRAVIYGGGGGGGAIHCIPVRIIHRILRYVYFKISSFFLSFFLFFLPSFLLPPLSPSSLPSLISFLSLFLSVFLSFYLFIYLSFLHSLFPSFFQSVRPPGYSQFPLRRTCSGPAPTVRLREVSVTEGVA